MVKIRQKFRKDAPVEKRENLRRATMVITVTLAALAALATPSTAATGFSPPSQRSLAPLSVAQINDCASPPASGWQLVGSLSGPGARAEICVYPFSPYF